MPVTIGGSSEEGTYRITQWYGLHESPDGDTKLKMGEAAVIKNWRITRDKNLQRRPGNAMIKGLLQNYKLVESSEPVVIRTDDNVSSKLIMYPNAFAGFDGMVTLYGTTVKVSYSNASEYAGYYWRRGSYFFYRLQSCVYDEDNDQYTWYGYKVVAYPDTDNSNYKVQGVWSGEIDGHEHLIAACNGHLWKLWNDETFEYIKEDLGEIDTTNRVTFFPFSDIVYILNGKEYMQFDGVQLRQVTGYRPLIFVSYLPAGGGTSLEEVNKLNGLRRIRYSPDGTSTEFVLPEKDLLSIDYVMDTASGDYIDPSEYSTDAYTGKVTFNEAPVAGTNTIEIGYSASAPYRGQVTSMTNAEIFLGAQDNAVFLYGNGTNKAVYSSIDSNGEPRADYFPDLNEMAVADSNTPITSLVRHLSRMICFKSSSAYSISYGTITDADGNSQYGFYVTPINRALGNEALGQVRIVLNSPFTLSGSDLFEWKSNSSYSSNLSSDERQARRISDRVFSTLSSYTLSDCYCFDDNVNQEYYICYGGEALVYNYAVDAWYRYTDFDAISMTYFRDHIIYGTSDGKIECLSYSYKANDGLAIDSYFESGSMDFGKEYQRKYSAQMWVGIKPESSGNVTVTVQTDKKSEYSEKVVSSDLFDFSHLNFSCLSFKTNRKPQMKRLKLKAKKFVYYKIIFKTSEPDTAATINSTDIRVRFTGMAK